MRTKTRANAARRKADVDPSREAVYAWEESWCDWSKNTLSLPECRAIIRRVCAKHKLPAPIVKQHGGGLSWCIPKLARISLQSEAKTPGNGGKNVATVLHEVAHYIAYRRHGDRIQDHGPTFLRIYLGLLVDHQVAPVAALTASARRHGLHW